MPGITVTTAVRTGPSSETVRESSQAFFVGLAQKGTAAQAVLVQNLAEFEEKFGTYQTYAYLHPTVQAFFEEGGTQCYIARVVGPAASTGTRTLNTAAAAAAIVLTADGAGSWSSTLKTIVLAGSGAASAKRNIQFWYNDELVYSTGLKSTNLELVTAINSSLVAKNFASATKSSDTIVAASASTAFSTGSDDRTDDTVDSTYTAYITALEKFSESYGPGAVSCPETRWINTDLLAHANTYNRIAILHSAEDDTVAEIKTEAGNLTGEDGSEHAAMYYPWVYAPSDINGVNRLIPPDGFVAGARAKAHNIVGPHQPGAGLLSAANFVNGVATDINGTDGNDLDDNNVNAIRIIANTVRVYGARSLSTDTDNFRYLSVQDTVNTVVHQAGRAMEDLLFAPIDSRNALFVSIHSILTGICATLANEGSLYVGRNQNGTITDPGYSVKCDNSNNSAAQIAEGKISAQIGLRVSPIGDKINVTIIKSNLTGSVTS